MKFWGSHADADRDAGRRTHRSDQINQIKEIIRLGITLRADMGLENTLAQIVEAISSTLGFRVAVLNLVQADSDHMSVVAVAGLTDGERQRLVQNPPPLQPLPDVMRPQFKKGHYSYFISHQYEHLLDGVEGVTVYTPLPPNASRPADAWHPSDVFFVPLTSARTGGLLGILSLDEPEDGKTPSDETVELIELFASQAALALETSWLFYEREYERQALEDQLKQLLLVLEQVQGHNLDVRAQLSDDQLGRIARSLNAGLEALSGVLRETRAAGEVVSGNAAETRETAIQLARSAQRQVQQILEISRAIEATATNMRTIAETAREVSAATREAIEVSQIGREAAERAAEGMGAVREMAFQSLKKMKRLSESSQEIGAI